MILTRGDCNRQLTPQTFDTLEGIEYNNDMEFLKKLNLTPSQQENFLAEAGEELLNRIVERCFDNLGKQEQAELHKLLDQEEAGLETIFPYLDAKLPHFYDLVGQEYLAMEQDLETIEKVLTNPA